MLLRFGIAHQIHLGNQIRLIQIFNGHSRGAQFARIHDGVEHAHASRIKLTHNPPILENVRGQGVSEAFRRRGEF